MLCQLQREAKGFRNAVLAYGSYPACETILVRGLIVALHEARLTVALDQAPERSTLDS